MLLTLLFILSVAIGAVTGLLAAHHYWVQPLRRELRHSRQAGRELFQCLCLLRAKTNQFDEPHDSGDWWKNNGGRP